MAERQVLRLYPGPQAEPDDVLTDWRKPSTNGSTPEIVDVMNLSTFPPPER
jgi:hypothetical protein